MWFIFPQLAGLGRSGMAQHYAIRDLEQAKRYLADSILGPRLREVVRLMIDHREKFASENACYRKCDNIISRKPERFRL
jgi:uncharacterized protein (DUF1810 family)